MTIREALKTIGYDLTKQVVPGHEIRVSLDSEVTKDGIEIAEQFCRPTPYDKAVAVKVRKFGGWFGDGVILYLEPDQAKVAVWSEYVNITHYLPRFFPPTPDEKRKEEAH